MCAVSGDVGRFELQRGEREVTAIVMTREQVKKLGLQDWLAKYPGLIEVKRSISVMQEALDEMDRKRRCRQFSKRNTK